jgi:hypothetical protein
MNEAAPSFRPAIDIDAPLWLQPALLPGDVQVTVSAQPTAVVRIKLSAAQVQRVNVVNLCCQSDAPGLFQAQPTRRLSHQDLTAKPLPPCTGNSLFGGRHGCGSS